MNKILKSSLALTLAVTAALPLASFAQPGGADGPSDERMGKMLEEQQKKRDEALRKTLKKLGYSDKTLQDKIVAYADERQKERLPLERATRKLAVVVGNKKSTEDQVRAALVAMRQAVTDERARRLQAQPELEDAEKKLDAEINFSKDPRLEANLMMMGLLGHETEMLTTAAPGYESEVSISENRPQGGMEGGGRSRGGGNFPGGGFPGGGMPRW